MGGNGWRAVTPIEWLGPAVPPDFFPSTLAERWQWGQGKMRVAHFDSDSFTAVALHEETLCVGTRGGLVRTIDIDSGDVVGDYYSGQHLPPSEVTALLFDGDVVVAGDARGAVRVWPARLPGSWGFAHSPDWVLSNPAFAGRAHAGRVSGIVSEGPHLISSDVDGNVVVWSRLGDTKEVEPKTKFTSGSPVNCLAADPDGRGVYAGLEDGRLVYFDTESEEAGEAETVVTFESAVTAMKYDSLSDSYMVGLRTGSLLRWKRGASYAAAFPKDLHDQAIQDMSIVHPPQDASGRDQSLLVTTGADGRLFVWDLASSSPYWGMENLKADRMAVGTDHGRLVTSGVVAAPTGKLTIRPKTRRSAKHLPRWTESPRALSDMDAVHGLFCVDFRESAKDEEETQEPFWPR